MKRLHLILTACLLLFLPATAGAQPKRCTPAEVRVMSYNIRLDLPSDKQNAWPYRRNEVIGQIAIVRPDILGMEEVLSNQRRDIARAFPGYELLGVGRDDGRDAGEYSPLAIRQDAFRILDSGTFWLSETPDRPSLGWDAGYKRIVTWARLIDRRSGTPILVLNTHWDNTGQVARRESASLMLRWIAAHRKPGERLLLLGDFNAELTDPAIKILTDSGLRDSREIATHVSGGETTFNDFHVVPAVAPPIDHILVGNNWSVSRYATIAQNFGGRVPSDHFPIVADMVTKSPKQPAACRQGEAKR